MLKKGRPHSRQQMIEARIRLVWFRLSKCSVDSILPWHVCFAERSSSNPWTKKKKKINIFKTSWNLNFQPKSSICDGLNGDTHCVTGSGECFVFTSSKVLWFIIPLTILQTHTQTHTSWEGAAGSSPRGGFHGAGWQTSWGCQPEKRKAFTFPRGSRDECIRGKKSPITLKPSMIFWKSPHEASGTTSDRNWTVTRELQIYILQQESRAAPSSFKPFQKKSMF